MCSRGTCACSSATESAGAPACMARARREVAEEPADGPAVVLGLGTAGGPDGWSRHVRAAGAVHRRPSAQLRCGPARLNGERVIESG